jgi:hypothetical protein
MHWQLLRHTFLSFVQPCLYILRRMDLLQRPYRREGRVWVRQSPLIIELEVLQVWAWAIQIV